MVIPIFVSVIRVSNGKADQKGDLPLCNERGIVLIISVEHYAKTNEINKEND
ncbi:hypothetical protein GCM10011338_37790 [Alteromonas lipolytica]|nr:hypothetical protein GCM10011338_37790 [Alteromonas lipolytica]